MPEAAGAPIAQSLNGSGDVILGFRPETVKIDSQGPLTGEVYATDLHGAYTMLHVQFGEDDIVHIRESRDEYYPVGSQVRFGIDPEMVRFFNPETEAAIQWEAVHG